MALGDNNEVSNAQIMHSIGQLTGSVQALHQGLTARIEDMRADIRRLDQASNDRMNRIEDNLSKQISDQGETLNKRIDDLNTEVGTKITGLGTRVTKLEETDKEIIKKVAYVSGASGVLVAVGVELLKRI